MQKQWCKILIACLVLWFVILQTIAPFVHAHIGSDALHEASGLHIHSIEINEVNDAVSALHTSLSSTSLNDYGLDGHVVTIDQGIAPSTSMKYLAYAFVLLFMLISALLTNQIVHLRSAAERTPLHLRSRLKPRAPPYF